MALISLISSEFLTFFFWFFLQVWTLLTLLNFSLSFISSEGNINIGVIVILNLWSDNSKHLCHTAILAPIVYQVVPWYPKGLQPDTKISAPSLICWAGPKLPFGLLVMFMKNQNRIFGRPAAKWHKYSEYSQLYIHGLTSNKSREGQLYTSGFWCLLCLLQWFVAMFLFMCLQFFASCWLFQSTEPYK